MKPTLLLKGMMQILIAVILIFLAAPVFAKDPGLYKAGAFFRPPVAGDDYFHLSSNTTITESYFANDSDPDGDSLSIDGITINTAGPHMLIETLTSTHPAYSWQTVGGVRVGRWRRPPAVDGQGSQMPDAKSQEEDAP